MAFDVKTATSLIQVYNGKEEDTEMFIESLELLNELTPAEQKPMMLKFIRTWITGRGKTAIIGGITTLEELKRKLQQKFTTKWSSDAILAQLKNCGQGSRNITDFTAQMENLLNQLIKAFVSEKVAEGHTAEKLTEKFSLQAYVSNLENPETAIILKAGEHKTLVEAATKASAIDNA